MLLGFTLCHYLPKLHLKNPFILEMLGALWKERWYCYICGAPCILHFQRANPANIYWSSKMSWKCLEDFLSRRLEDFLKTFWRHPARPLEDVLEDEKLLRWRYLEDVLKTCLEDVLKTCLEDVLKTCLEDVLKTLKRQAKYLLEISVSNKSKCVFNKSIFHKSICDKSKPNPKCIN